MSNGNSGFFTTQQLCRRYACSSRTLHRWQQAKENPFPAPSMACRGATNRWKREDVFKWENATNTQTTDEETTDDQAHAA